MKQVFGTYLLSAALVMLTVPATALAQDTTVQNKEQKEVEQIIITRTGDKKEKTVIEITGDAIIVNGKDAKELKGNISVQRNRVRDFDALVSMRAARAPRAGTNFNFNMTDGDQNFFRADSSRAMLGVVMAEDDKGARINSVSKNSGAEKAGLKSGDIITRINDTRISEAGDITKVVRSRKPGDKVTITYLRDGKEQKAEAELTAWKGLSVAGNNFRVMVPGRVTPFEGNPDFREFHFESGSRPKMGMSVQDSEDGKGVLVQEVEEESNAAKSGIRKGDVITHFNGEAVNSVDELRRQLAASRNKITTPVKLMRAGKEQSLELRMPRKLKTADL